MTKINKKVWRETYGTQFERSKRRPVCVVIEPPNLIGFRLKGTRRTYYLTSDALYMTALRAQLAADKKEKARLRAERKKAKL